MDHAASVGRQDAAAIRDGEDRRRRAIRIGYAVTAVSVFGASSVTPVLPSIGQAFGVDGAATALLVSLFILPMAVLTLPIGYLADRYSLRPILVGCLLLYGVVGLACVMAPDFRTLLLLRILQGCGAAALELFGLVILIEAAPPEQLNTVIGRNAGVIGLSVTTAPLLSGLLSLISWRVTFVVSAAALPLAYLALAGLPTLPRTLDRERPALRVFLSNARVWKALVATLAVFLFAFGGLLTFIEARAFIWLLVGALLLGVGHGLLFPLSQAMLAREAPSQRGVLFLSLNITAIGISQTLSPLLMSAVYDRFGLRSVFVVAFAVSLALAPLSWIFLRRSDGARTN